MKSFLVCLLAFASLFGNAAQADTAVKVQVVNFTAEWCSACRIFDPRLREALVELNDPSIQWIPFDMTITRTGTAQQRKSFWDNLQTAMSSRGIGPLYKGFNGFPNTGYAVIIAADTKEPLVCVMGAIPVDRLKTQLLAAKQRVENRPQFQRVPEGADCPPSYN